MISIPLISRLYQWARRIYADPQRDASYLFPHGFNTPFESPQGLIHEVYSIREIGGYVNLRISRLTHRPVLQSKGILYSIRAEVELPVEEDLWFDPSFVASPAAFLRANPHYATKRVVRNVCMFDTVLADHVQHRG